jgi:hypothetical protein
VTHDWFLRRDYRIWTFLSLVCRLGLPGLFSYRVDRIMRNPTFFVILESRWISVMTFILPLFVDFSGCMRKHVLLLNNSCTSDCYISYFMHILRKGMPLRLIDSNVSIPISY